MYLASQKKRSGNLITQGVAFAVFLLGVCTLAFHARAYGQIADTGKANRNILPGRSAIDRAAAPEVTDATGQSVLELYINKIRSSAPLRRKLLISAALFLLLLLTLTFFVVKMLRQLRGYREVDTRAEANRHNLISVSIGRLTFFIGRRAERAPKLVKKTVKKIVEPSQIYVE